MVVSPQARWPRVLAWTASGTLLAFLTTWAFLGYLSPDRVFDFASLLQMCGIPLSR